MLEFLLFRIRVLPNTQTILSFDEGRTRPQILREIMESAPSREFYRGRIWHIGNVEAIGRDGIYLRIGKTITTPLEVYANGRFTDIEFESAPYTHIIVDVPREVCAIARKSSLATNTVTIAKRFIRILEGADKAKELNATLEIDPINDPSNFIQFLQAATAVSRFEVSVGRPNPWDVEEDFVKPNERALEASRGEAAHVTFLGKDLDADWLEEITRSVAAAGQEAKATLTLPDKHGKQQKVLGNNGVSVSVDDISQPEEKQDALTAVQVKYQSIRRTEGEVGGSEGTP